MSRSTTESTTVLDLAERIWRRINGVNPFSYVSDPPFEHDVQKRGPATTKAKNSWDSRPPPRSTRCWTKACPGSSTL
jgi:hypothetical protein